jgi:sugar phosphate isomerase/epimerase
LVVKTSRRSFLALSAAAPFVRAAFPAGGHIPVGLELFSVRDELAKDIPSTVRAVAKMGYEDVEFFSPYASWTPERAKEIRAVMNDAGIRCRSTHNGGESFTADGLQRAIELNKILGSTYIVWASAGRVTTLDGWKKVADQLTQTSEKLQAVNMKTGYHNHQLEFIPVEGKRPMEVIAAGTPKSVMLQFDVGTCVEAGSDPVAWVEANPGRIRSMHLKDWAPGEGYKVLFGEGKVPWAKLLEAAETTGGVEFYLIEQEGSRFPSLETAERCLANFKKLRA